MAVMRTVGSGHQLPTHAHVREEPGRYLIELDLSDFAENELTIQAQGQRVTVRGNQLETPEDFGRAFRLCERIEESFRLPDEVDAGRIKVFYKHGKLEIDAPRDGRPHTVPIERRRYAVNADAEPC